MESRRKHPCGGSGHAGSGLPLTAGVFTAPARKDVIRTDAFSTRLRRVWRQQALASGQRWRLPILEAGTAGRPAAQSAAGGVGMLLKVPEGLSRTFNRFSGHAITAALPSTSEMSMNPPLASRCARESAE